MTNFWDNAKKLMDAAVDAAAAGGHSESLTVLIGAEGGIHLIADCDWPLHRVAAERGAQMAYRVTNQKGCIAVTGQQGDTTCQMQTKAPPQPFLALLRDQPRYFL
ncbi:MAG: hypothetical protein JNL98_04665 [Bryobacterales bacterium]|nr:hypothetical protein [Bryobacterales bacterium]